MKRKAFAWILVAVMALACVGAVAEGRTLTVQGAGVVDATADLATISIGVQQVGADVSAAQTDVNGKIEAIISALVEKGLDRGNISTGSIGLYANYDYSSDAESISGYTVYNSLFVSTTDIDGVGGYIDAAFAAGANNLDYVDFSVTNTSEPGAKALELAVANAQEKAQVIADAAGLKLGDILEINESPSDAYSMPMMYAKEEDAGAGTQVIPSKKQINASVTVTFELIAED